MKILVTGAGGLVGRATVKQCVSIGDEVIAATRAVLDIADAEAVNQFLAENKPDAVINCAAWTDVDGCELDAARCYAQNADAVGHLAAATRATGALLVTISTDYVFDGAKDGFYTQRDDPNPQSIYGQAKLAGERRAQELNARTSVVRSGWIFGTGGKNFLSKVVDYARGGAQLKAIYDSYGTPTYAVDLAVALRELAELDLPGVYHIVNQGRGASFEDFTRYALELAGLPTENLERVSMDDLTRPAPRPRNSRLRCLLSEKIGLTPLPEWKESVENWLKF